MSYYSVATRLGLIRGRTFLEGLSAPSIDLNAFDSIFNLHNEHTVVSLRHCLSHN